MPFASGTLTKVITAGRTFKRGTKPDLAHPNEGADEFGPSKCECAPSQPGGGTSFGRAGFVTPECRRGRIFLLGSRESRDPYLFL
jgi:hypothetical protein